MGSRISILNSLKSKLIKEDVSVETVETDDGEILTFDRVYNPEISANVKVFKDVEGDEWIVGEEEEIVRTAAPIFKKDIASEGGAIAPFAFALTEYAKIPSKEADEIGKILVNTSGEAAIALIDALIKGDWVSFVEDIAQYDGIEAVILCFNSDGEYIPVKDSTNFAIKLTA